MLLCDEQRLLRERGHRRVLIIINDKLDFINIITACFPKDTMKKIKRQITKWKKVFTIFVSNKRLKARIYEVFLQCNNNKQIVQFEKNWIDFIKEDT